MTVQVAEEACRPRFGECLAVTLHPGVAIDIALREKSTGHAFLETTIWTNVGAKKVEWRNYGGQPGFWFGQTVASLIALRVQEVLGKPVSHTDEGLGDEELSLTFSQDYPTFDSWMKTQFPGPMGIAFKAWFRDDLDAQDLKEIERVLNRKEIDPA